MALISKRILTYLCRLGSKLEGYFRAPLFFHSASHSDSRPIPTDSEILGNDISEFARLVFTDKADDYSETELISATSSLHVCISQLSAHLIREKNRVPRPSESFIPSFEEDTIGSRVRKALGDKLIEQLDGVHTKSNGPVNRIIRDGIEAWSTYCMYSATEPMLFGEMSRNCKEIADIYACMHDKDPELWSCWKLIRDRSIPCDIQNADRNFLQNSEGPNIALPDDMKTFESEGLKNAYIATITRDYPLPVCLHWRALLHKHELELGSYSRAKSRTEEVLRQGLNRVFIIAGVDASAFWENAPVRSSISRVVDAAATLAKYAKTGIFSENIEVVMVEPGSTYDEKTMKSVNGLGKGKVKCTLKLGLRVDGKRTLLKPEVLLAESPEVWSIKIPSSRRTIITVISSLLSCAALALGWHFL